MNVAVVTDQCWLYLVVSSDAQEDTLDAQRRWGFEEAARIGAKVDPDGIFEGVASGKDGARTILLDLIGRLQALPKSQRPGRVLMTRLDRVGRMPLDAISAMNEIRKLGVVIRDRVNGDYTFQRVIDMVGPVFTSLQAGFENEVRSDRSKAGHKRRRDDGKLIPAKPPYGVTRDERGYAIPDPKCAPIIRELFERWARGDSPADLVVWLRECAPPRKARVTSKNPTGEIGIQWSLSHVYKAVRLGTYRGVVVDEELWQRAQQRRPKDSKPGKGGYVYPFSGIRCSCGHTLRARTNTGATRHRLKDGTVKMYARKAATVWYVCQSMKHSDGPRFRSFREDKIEAEWLKVLKRLAQGRGPWDTAPRATDLGPQIAMMQKRLDVLLSRRDRIHTAFEEGAYDAKTMQQRLAVVEREEEKLLADIEATKRQYETQRQRKLNFEKASKLIKNAAALYEAADRQEQYTVNQALFAMFGRPVVADGYRLKFSD